MSVLLKHTCELAEKYRKLKPRQAFVLFQALLASAFIFPMGIWRLFRGDIYQGIFDIVLSTIFVAMGWLATNNKYYKLASRVFAISYTLGVWIVVQFIGVIGLYWAFAVAVAMFFAARRVDAVILATVTYCASIYGVWGDVEPMVIATFTACYTLVVFFCYHFSSRLMSDYVRISAEAATDTLTLIGNRRALEDHIQEIISDKRRTSYSMIMIDVDYFKFVNDTWGHDIGDMVLKRIVEAIKQAIGTQDEVYRYGGEEFTIITPTNLTSARDLAEKVRVSLETQRFIRGSDHLVTLSMGVSELKDDDDSRSWVRRSDAALYESKENGRNQVHYRI